MINSLHGEALPEWRRGTFRKRLRCCYDHFLSQKVWVLLWALLFLTLVMNDTFYINCFVFSWASEECQASQKIFPTPDRFCFVNLPRFDSRKEGQSYQFLPKRIGLDLPQKKSTSRVFKRTERIRRRLVSKSRIGWLFMDGRFVLYIESTSQWLNESGCLCNYLVF